MIYPFINRKSFNFMNLKVYNFIYFEFIRDFFYVIWILNTKENIKIKFT
jgi:hypothetical protein